MEAYTPYPIKDLDEIIPGHNFVPPIVLIGGLIGAATAWSMEYYIAASIIRSMSAVGRCIAGRCSSPSCSS